MAALAAWPTGWGDFLVARSRSAKAIAEAAINMTSPHSLVLSPFWSLPLWLIFLMVAAMFLVGHELGVQLRRRTRRGPAGEQEDNEGIGGNYLTASLTLLALLVGFSFSMGVDRYNTRSHMVRDEANAISTTYRRLATMTEPDRTTLGPSFMFYLEAREAFSSAHTSDQIHAADLRTDEMQMRLWSTATHTLAAPDPSSRAVLEAINAMFNVAASRRAALEFVIPHTVLAALLLYGAIAAAFLGYSHPIKRRYFVASTIQFGLLALAFTLIIDLDRPRTGLVEVSQAPLYRAAAFIRQAEKERAVGRSVRLAPS